MALPAEMQFGKGVVPRPSRSFKLPGNTATLTVRGGILRPFTSGGNSDKARQIRM
jgi:hypothetical protein